VLREDARATDHLGEPWAVPLQEARLSSFLAADHNVSTDTGPEVLEAFLSGQIIDLQSLLNVNNLVAADGKVSDPDLLGFARLFDLLGLPLPQLERLAENLRFASDTSVANRSSPMAPLLPQQVEQLVWLGLSAQTISVLQPYITILPARTTVNVNTASAQVLYASVDGLSIADAQRLVSLRERAPFRTKVEAQNAIKADGPTAVPGQVINIDVVSRFFEIRSRLRLDQLVVEERALVRRDGNSMIVEQRQRGATDARAPLQAAATR
jgi:general secretion pathway protein K